MIKTVTNLTIATFRDIYTNEPSFEKLDITYLDENGEERRIEGLEHTEDIGMYDVRTDDWEDILEDWRLTKPYCASVEGWNLLEEYLQNLTEEQCDELRLHQLKRFEAAKVADILRGIERLSVIGRDTLNEVLEDKSSDVQGEYEKQWNRFMEQRREEKDA